MSRHATIAATVERDRLRGGAAALGVTLDDVALAELAIFLDMLARWGERTNLVGERDRDALIERHLVDSLAAAPLLIGLGAQRIADLGSGAGLPGVPLAAATRPHETLLVEPRRKRASFLHAVRRALPGLGLSVIERRATELATAPADHLDAIVSRAALPDAELLREAGPRLRTGGLLIAYRGHGGGTADLAAAPGFRPPRLVDYTLGAAARRFSLVVWERERFT